MSHKNYLGIILLLALLGLGYLTFLDREQTKKETEKNIVSFKDCVDAGNPVMESFPEQCRTKDGVHFVNWRATDQVCIQVITSAKNSKTNEVRNFPTPCDVPSDWQKI